MAILVENKKIVEGNRESVSTKVEIENAVSNRFRFCSSDGTRLELKQCDCRTDRCSLPTKKKNITCWKEKNKIWKGFEDRLIASLWGQVMALSSKRRDNESEIWPPMHPCDSQELVYKLCLLEFWNLNYGITTTPTDWARLVWVLTILIRLPSYLSLATFSKRLKSREMDFRSRRRVAAHDKPSIIEMHTESPATKI